MTVGAPREGVSPHIVRTADHEAKRKAGRRMLCTLSCTSSIRRDTGLWFRFCSGIYLWVGFLGFCFGVVHT